MTTVDPTTRRTAVEGGVRGPDDVVRVFASYSYKDPSYLRDDSLLGFLRWMSADAGAEFWTDERITASSLWNDEIRSQLERSNLQRPKV